MNTLEDNISTPTVAHKIVKKAKSTRGAKTECSKSVTTKNLLIAHKFYRSKVPKFSRKRKLQVTVIAKKYKLRCLSRKSEFFLKSFKEQERYMNFTFPLESRFNSTNPSDLTTHFSPFFSLMKFKRVKNIELDTKEDTWKYALEERWFSATEKAGDTLFQIFDHLEKMHNVNALNVKDLLRQWINYLSNTMKGGISGLPQIAVGHQSTSDDAVLIEPNTMNEDPFRKYKKIYMNEKCLIDRSLMKEIKKNAFICFTEEYNFSEYSFNCFQESGLSYTHNKRLFDMIGGFGIRLNGMCEGFQILRHISSRDWVLYLKEVLQFRLNDNCNEVMLSENSLHLLDINGRIITDQVKLYKEVYTVGKKMWHHLYVIFLMK
jgi:hypothetical protein